MHGVWTPDQVRAAEQRLFRTVAEPVVMRRAANGLALWVRRLLAERLGRVAGRRVALLVGAGNNGGDALWAGALLRDRGVGVTAVLLSPEKTHPEGLRALRAAGGRVVAAADAADDPGLADVAAEALRRADVVVDGIVGLAAHGPLRPLAAAAVNRVNAPVVAVDLPSGVDPVTGAVDGPAVSATLTVTFGGRKPCHVLGAGLVRSGEVVVVDIGLDPHLEEPDCSVPEAGEVGRSWPVPRPADDKYSQGVLGVAAGSANFPGAAMLAAGGAVHTASGMVRYAGPAADAVRQRWPEVVAVGSVGDAGRVQAWSVGPGIGTGAAGREVLAAVLDDAKPVVADADAITLFAGDETLWDVRDPDVPLVLTPHEGEFARLAGQRPADRVAAVREVARRCSAVVLLKGNTTVIADPDGRVLVHPCEQAWPATAGSGDVLTGMIGKLLAAGTDPLWACGSAAHVHARAAEIAAAGGRAPTASAEPCDADPVGAPIGASALLDAVPDAVREVRAVAATTP
ncbi:yjeF C-terminal region, hydroxyethylthiazole kinase-related/yjeF N-terminal region [Actinopolyspora alba]|uniref:Bifunctional NAD(P)H-hydrate repair enzyme n=1 Tax=Actinopolyspora alba TaxID=673379 RepID=A0A1I1W663_9ACTN|nr:yjeF C-terminal region, hydroxyethylthiazole kinase-related/yjeF N-terminal region [Actinopolyspora alba]